MSSRQGNLCFNFGLLYWYKNFTNTELEQSKSFEKISDECITQKVFITV